MSGYRNGIAGSLFLLALVLFSSLGHAQDSAVRSRQDIHYGPHSLQTVDVYWTAYCKTVKCPVVLWVHGGGWRNGDAGRAQSVTMQKLWAQQGIVMVGVNYRLTPEVMHPAHVQDVAAAINWVRRNIHNYGGDKTRVSLLGHSAGAHLVALVATNPAYLAYHSLAPAVVIKNVFPIDTASFDLTSPSAFVARMVKDAFGTNPAVLREASPIWQVHDNGAYPAFIIAAAKNRPDAVQTSEKLLQKLKSAGTRAELVVVNYPGAGQLEAHRLIAQDLGNLDSVMTQALLERVLTGK